MRWGAAVVVEDCESGLARIGQEQTVLSGFVARRLLDETGGAREIKASDRRAA
jgi:hypothetical protein